MAIPRSKIFLGVSAGRFDAVHYNLERGRNVWPGGSFNNQRRNARSSYRNNNQLDEQNQNLGFRLAGGRGTGLRA